MDRSDRKGLLLVLAVTVLVITVHVLFSIYNRPIVKTWSMPATATLDFAAPCAATVTITPAAGQGNFIIIAKARHGREIKNLASGPGTDGAASIFHAADCPDRPTLTLAVSVPAGTAIHIDDEADTDYSIGPGASALSVLSAGSGDIHAASIGNLAARLAGDGDLEIGTVNGDIDATLANSGDLQIGQIAARNTKLALLGDGDARLGTGSAGALVARLDGSGDLTADSAASADLILSNDGDVTIGEVSGNLRAALSDDGDLKIDSVGGDATLTMSGDGDVTIPRLAGHLTQTHSGDGDLHINGS